MSFESILPVLLWGSLSGSVYVYLSLPVCVCLAVCLSISPCLCVCLCVSLSLSLSCVPVCLSVSSCLCFCLCVSISIPVFPCVSLSFCLPLSVCVFVSLSVIITLHATCSSILKLLSSYSRGSNGVDIVCSYRSMWICKTRQEDLPRSGLNLSDLNACSWSWVHSFPGFRSLHSSHNKQPVDLHWYERLPVDLCSMPTCNCGLDNGQTDKEFRQYLWQQPSCPAPRPQCHMMSVLSVQSERKYQ